MAATFQFCKYYFTTYQQNELSSTSQNATPLMNCDYKIQRLSGFKYIRPLEFAEPECESVKYASLKMDIANLIQSLINSGNINTASVYLRDFDKADWMVVNPNESFHAASMLKISALITLLKMEEKNHGFLNKKLTFSKRSSTMPVQVFNSKQIELGKSYTIKELLEYMIAYSDNDATKLLHDVMDWEEYRKTYFNLGLKVPDVYKTGYTINTKDYSTFFKILYNAGYLTIEHSEFACELLSKCDFDKGFAAGIQNSTAMAHKFGEWGDGSSHELHESGLIYLNGATYLLTVMTRGKDVQKLPEVIATISKNVYEKLKPSGT